MLSTTTFNRDIMKTGAAGGFTNATDAADYLVRKGLPFRQAHEVIGKMVLACVHENQSLHQLSLCELKEFSPLIEEDFYDAIDLMRCVNDRNIPGGPAEEAVQKHIEQGRALLKAE
jgi:argininosuccinate lyase